MLGKILKAKQSPLIVPKPLTHKMKIRFHCGRCTHTWVTRKHDLYEAKGAIGGGRWLHHYYIVKCPNCGDETKAFNPYEQLHNIS